MRSPIMYLNGKALKLEDNDELPVMEGEKVSAGAVEVAPGACVFFVL